MKWTKSTILAGIFALSLFVIGIYPIMALTAGVRWGKDNAYRNFTKSIWVDNDANVDGRTTLDDAVITSATITTLSVDALTTTSTSFTATATVTGADLAATDDLTVGDDATISGLAVVKETVTVHGDTTLHGAVTTTGVLTAEHVTSTDDMTVTDDLAVHGDTTLHGNITTTGTLVGAKRTIVDTTTSGTTNLTAAQSGAVCILSTQTGAQGNRIFVLPAAAAGLEFTFVDGDGTAAADLWITAGTGDKVNGGTAAKSYKCTADATGLPQTVTFVAKDATDWVIVAEKGTWANDNT